ncbi:MAG: radical SAM protein [Nitrososphaerota archaeon]|nr:radical SAM protein [Nitrososphaerota archaeon]MDG7039016.1 radical SAM protein [Nitrososphaerota archaeon]MDG7045356.1 radical SAM protein [Nitrososphaerota archaeon]
MRILILNLPGLVLKSGSRWYNVTKKSQASLKYYPYPWFMGYTTSLLKNNGFEAVLKDAIALEWSLQETLEYIKAFNPQYIICEPTWVSVRDDKLLLDAIGNNIKKIAVGNYATNYPYDCLRDTGVDYVAVGEYEFSLLEFFRNNGRKLPENFVYSSKKDYKMPPLVSNLDLFPFPERDDTPIKFYNEPSCYGKNVVMVSSRGCRFQCSFCNIERVYGKHIYRKRSAENVVDEMVYLKNKYKFDEIYFDDDNMVSDKSHIEGICREIIKRGLKIKWLCMGDGFVTDETLELLAKAGCVSYKYGLEHLDDEVLKAIPKPIPSERRLGIIKKCKELGLRSYVNLIVGLPKSSWEKDLKMIKDVINEDPDFIQIAIATPYPGTRFYQEAKEKGWLISEDPTYFDATGRSAISYPDYSAPKIEEMFYLGWKLWYRHIREKPMKLKFYFMSEMKRNGLPSTIKKTMAYFLKSL